MGSMGLGRGLGVPFKGFTGLYKVIWGLYKGFIGFI